MKKTQPKTKTSKPKMPQVKGKNLGKMTELNMGKMPKGKKKY